MPPLVCNSTLPLPRHLDLLSWRDHAPRHVLCGPGCAWNREHRADCPGMWRDMAIKFCADLATGKIRNPRDTTVERAHAVMSAAFDANDLWVVHGFVGPANGRLAPEIWKFINESA